MKILVVCASFLVAISAISDGEAWTDFKQTFSKEYRSIREEKIRFQVFKSNLNTIKKHNARYKNGEESYTMGINQFADLTSKEFNEQYLTLQKPISSSSETFKIPEGFIPPESIDWRSKGVVLPVKNQGDCGSCWAFSAIGSLEGQNAIKHNITIDLSEQELVDCSNGKYGNSACGGGLMIKAFNYLIDNGISTYFSYPYIARNRTCSKSTHPRTSVKVTGYMTVPATESALVAAVASVGPISIAIAGEQIQLYSSGIFDNPLCGNDLDHAVLAVGYGEANNKQYWMVKNSWGARWGEDGYIRMSRNKNNQCGIASQSSYPVIA